MTNTMELLVQELETRIGQIVAQYEMQLAIVKIQANESLREKDFEIEQLKLKEES